MSSAPIIPSQKASREADVALAGTYKYALLIDGKTIEVKTMMKSK
jgi:hypothetical protein